MKMENERNSKLIEDLRKVIWNYCFFWNKIKLEGCINCFIGFFDFLFGYTYGFRSYLYFIKFFCVRKKSFIPFFFYICKNICYFCFELAVIIRAPFLRFSRISLVDSFVNLTVRIVIDPSNFISEKTVISDYLS